MTELSRLTSETPLTQFGDVHDRGFTKKPRARLDVDGVSLIAGRLTVEEAKAKISRNPVRPGEAVRHTTVGRLTDSGFQVTRTPTRNNPDHVSVEYSGQWDDDVCERFEACFGPPEIAEKK